MNGLELIHLLKKEKNDSIFTFARIGEVTNQGCSLILNMENIPTKKKYKRISSYNPLVGDKVLVLKMAGTYLILGKII